MGKAVTCFYDKCVNLIQGEERQYHILKAMDVSFVRGEANICDEYGTGGSPRGAEVSCILINVSCSERKRGEEAFRSGRINI